MRQVGINKGYVIKNMKENQVNQLDITEPSILQHQIITKEQEMKGLQQQVQETIAYLDLPSNQTTQIDPNTNNEQNDVQSPLKYIEDKKQELSQKYSNIRKMKRGHTTTGFQNKLLEKANHIQGKSLQIEQLDSARRLRKTSSAKEQNQEIQNINKVYGKNQ